MSPTIPSSVISQLVKSAHQDPSLPRPHPSLAFWQLPESELAHHRSSELSSQTTYAIIGSGVTGCSVAKNLLESLPADSGASVTVFEARALTSGATGRNGGHLISPLPHVFSYIEKVLGKDEATKIGRFANRTLDAMYALSDESSELSEAGETRRVTSVGAFYDQKVFDETRQSWIRYEQCLPECRGEHQVFGPEEALRKFNIKDSVGVISTTRAGAFWPYRLITRIFARLLEQYTDRFTIETDTPVSKVDLDPSSDPEHPYILTTSRGKVRASKVIYCSNGWTGHLLPRLQGKIFPVRGTMSVQKAGPDFSNQGNTRSWSAVTKPSYNAAENTLATGLYYVNQNAHTGDIFIGGEKQHPSEIISSDDTIVSEVSRDRLGQVLPEMFEKGWREGEKPEVKQVWSGIMGYTPDHLPWVGRLSASISGREGDGEYMAAGFNGYGMPLCWGCGEAVAKMLLGKDDEVNNWLPASFLISKRRLNSPYSRTEAGMYALLEQEPGTWAIAKMVAKNTARVAYETASGIVRLKF